MTSPALKRILDRVAPIKCAVLLAAGMARRRAIWVAPIGMSEIAMDSCVRFARAQEHPGLLA